MEENKTIAEVSTATTDIISGLKESSDLMYCSFKVESVEDKIRLYNAVSGTSDSHETIKANVNKVLEVRDVVVMSANVTDDNGVTQTVPRITFILADGRTLSAASWGVYRALQKIAGIFQTLSFDPPIKMMPVEVKTKRGFTITLKLV